MVASALEARLAPSPDKAVSLAEPSEKSSSWSSLIGGPSFSKS